MKLLILLLTLSVAGFAADVTGNWNITAPTRNGGEMKVRLSIHADKDSYSGVISNEEGEAVLRDVRVKDGEMTFLVETDKDTYEVAATVSGDIIKGSYKVNKTPGGTFTGTRGQSTT